MFEQRIKQNLPDIEYSIKKNIDSFNLNPLLKEMVEYQMQSGGKRLRPVILLEINRLLDGDRKLALNMAAVLEIIHNASLVHDDIQDGDEIRRGRLSAWKKFSKNQAINLGDILMDIALESVLSFKVDEKAKVFLTKLVLKSIRELIAGQIYDLNHENRFDTTIDEYYKIISGKTGSLFRLAILGGYFTSNKQTPSFENTFLELGTQIGILFQLRDDLIEFSGKKDGRDEFTDIIDGKATLPHVLALEFLKREQKEKYISLILKSPKNINSSNLIKDFLITEGIFTKSMAHMKSVIDKISKITKSINIADLTIFIDDLIQFLTTVLEENK